MFHENVFIRFQSLRLCNLHLLHITKVISPKGTFCFFEGNFPVNLSLPRLNKLIKFLLIEMEISFGKN